MYLFLVIVGCNVDYTVDYVLIEKEGEEYFNITKGSSDITLERVYFNLTNLFNGNEELGKLIFLHKIFMAGCLLFWHFRGIYKQSSKRGMGKTSGWTETSC